jgi:hypothetical protein
MVGHDDRAGRLLHYIGRDKSYRVSARPMRNLYTYSGYCGVDPICDYTFLSDVLVKGGSDVLVIAVIVREVVYDTSSG